MPTSSAVTQARKRLGRKVFAESFERTCGPVAGESGPAAAMTALGTARGSFLRNWRLLAIDGFEVYVPYSGDNAAEFGYAGSGDNRSAFPKARVVAIAECRTHAFVAAEISACGTEKTLAQRLYPRLCPDQLLTADRGFYSWQAWDTAQATGGAVVAGPYPARPARGARPARRHLPDRPDQAAIRARQRERPPAAARARDDLDDISTVPDAFDEQGLPVVHLARVVEYGVPDRDGSGTGELIVLLSTILGPDGDTAPGPASWPPATTSGARKKPETTSSRHTCAAPASSCAPGCRTWSIRKSGPI